MKLKIITQLLVDAYKNEIENKLWQQWLVYLSNMDNEHFTSFNDFKQEAMKVPERTSKVDVSEVLKEAEEIKAMDQNIQ